MDEIGETKENMLLQKIGSIDYMIKMEVNRAIENIAEIVKNTNETYIENVIENGEGVEKECLCTPESIKESILEDIKNYKLKK